MCKSERTSERMNPKKNPHTYSYSSSSSSNSSNYSTEWIGLITRVKAHRDERKCRKTATCVIYLICICMSAICGGTSHFDFKHNVSVPPQQKPIPYYSVYCYGTWRKRAANNVWNNTHQKKNHQPSKGKQS